MKHLLAIAAWSIASFAAACSICRNPINRATLGEEMENASLIIIGTLSNPRLNPNPLAGAGAGTTDFAVERILKNDAQHKLTPTISLPRYMPVPDPKNPPRYLVFYEMFRDKLEVVQGTLVKSASLPAYLDEARAARAQGRVPALVFYAKHLDHDEDVIALDAFTEFAKSKDIDVAKAATLLDPAPLRRLLAKSDLDADRLSLFSFLLGCCGQDRDADDLLRLAGNLSGERRTSLDGIYAGYVALRPQDGWKKLTTILADAKQPFATRFSALRAIGMLQGWKGTAIKNEVLAAYKHSIRDGEMADLAIEDLRRWQWWDLTTDIAAQFGQPTHRAPIVQHCLIRYALSCPLPEAKQLVERARQIEPDYVEDQEKLIVPSPGR